MTSTKDTSTTQSSGKLELPPRAELILGGIGLALILGWIVNWVQNGFDLFGSAFPVLSFFGSAVLVVWIGMKPFRVFSLPAHVEQRIVPVVSLLPILGYLVHVLSRPHEFLTIGGSVALAYFSAITYWRKQFLEIASAQVGSRKESSPESRTANEKSRESEGTEDGIEVAEPEKVPTAKEEGPQKKKPEPAQANAGTQKKKKRKKSRKGKKGKQASKSKETVSAE